MDLLNPDIIQQLVDKLLTVPVLFGFLAVLFVFMRVISKLIETIQSISKH